VPTPELAQQLVDIGSTALLVFLVVLIFVGLFRRWWVPGWMYDRLEQDWKLLRDQTDRNAKVLEAMADREQRDRDRGGR
jgi:hypothetical protein